MAARDLRVAGLASMKAAIYVRSEKGDEDSVNSQIEACKSKAKALGMEVTGVYIDDGANSKELGKLITDMGIGEHDTIIVKSITKIASKIVKISDVCQAIDKIGGNVVCIDDCLNTTDNALFFSLLNMVADIERTL